MMNNLSIMFASGDTDGVVGVFLVFHFVGLLVFTIAVLASDKTKVKEGTQEKGDEWKGVEEEFKRKEREWNEYRQNFLEKKRVHDIEVQKEEKRKAKERATRGTVLWAYRILECDEDFTNDQIKSAHREAIKKWHPDNIQMITDNQRLKEIIDQGMQDVNLAWEVLERARRVR